VAGGVANAGGGVGTKELGSNNKWKVLDDIQTTSDEESVKVCSLTITLLVNVCPEIVACPINSFFRVGPILSSLFVDVTLY
jgi:hypothetical protein